MLLVVDGSLEEKMLAYNEANRQVAVLCNHQVWLQARQTLFLLVSLHTTAALSVQDTRPADGEDRW